MRDADQDPLVQEALSRAASALERQAWEEAHAACMEVLKTAPLTADAYYYLGVIAAEHGNHTRACEIFDRAIQIKPVDGRYHADRARSLLALNRRADAIDTALRAGQCRGLSARTLDTVGVVLSRAGLHDEATSYYQRATALAPDQVSYWYNFGAALQFQGELDAARKAYRKTLALDGAHVKAWSALVQITKQTATHNETDTLSALFARLDDADDRLHIGHALAKCHEDLGHPDAAMTWLARAKSAKAASLASSVTRDAGLFAAAARTASGAAGGPGHADPSAIFIVGLPRSGTTLVDRILSRHSQIRSAGELTDFALAVKRSTRTPSAYVLDEATLEAGMTADLEQIGETYVRAARRIAGTAHDAPRFIDKMPLNIFLAGLIHRALPNARIICLRRHPADSVLSNYRQLFATGFSYYNYAYDLADTARYYVEFDQLVSIFRGSLPAARFTEVWYEDVVEDLETQARRLIDFCGLDWEPACLEFHRNTAPVATASSAQVRQPLYSSSVGRWQRVRHQMKPALDILADNGLLDETA